MKEAKERFAASFAALLLAATLAPLTVLPVSAEQSITPVTLSTHGNWTYIQNDLITVAFPAGGKKPMFLWWYTRDPSNINVVKFKGLVEYYTYEQPYFLWRCQGERLRIREEIIARYFEPKRGMFRPQEATIWRILNEIGNYPDLHAPYLPFSGCKWNLEGPMNVTKGEVSYLSFNFTLGDVPGYRPHFQFAEDNIIIRCRFYYTPATETAYGKYTYTVSAGELKIDIVIKHWEWSIDKLTDLINSLRNIGLDIPRSKPHLALWINLASVNVTNMAEKDAQSQEDADFTEGASTAKNMYVEGEQVSVVPDNVEKADEIPLGRRRERFRVRFEKGNATFAGFFKFVPQAIVTDGTTYNVTDVTASYVSAGNHMRLFIGYPYFGNNTLEHDPSLGVESTVPWLPINLMMVLVGATIVIAVAVAAIKLRKKTVNVMNVH